MYMVHRTRRNDGLEQCDCLPTEIHHNADSIQITMDVIMWIHGGHASHMIRWVASGQCIRIMRTDVNIRGKYGLSVFEFVSLYVR